MNEEVNEIKKEKKKLSKKAKIIIIIACFVIGAALGTGSYLLFSSPGGSLSVTAKDGTDIKGIEKEWEQAESTNIDGAPDTTVKAAMIRKLKNAEETTQMRKFNKLKEYDAFRIYDIEATSEELTDVQKVILVVYFKDNGGAVVYFADTYKDSADRAKKLTETIEALDKDYEHYAAEARGITEQKQILY